MGFLYEIFPMKTDNFLLHDSLNTFVDTFACDFQDNDTFYVWQEDAGVGSIELMLSDGLTCSIEGINGIFF